MDWKNKPLITVIVPVYNDELFLEKCLRSIQNQTYSNLEILLIDDGSIDSSPLILDKFEKEDSRIRVIHKHNTGVSNSRNLGMKEAKGKYICFSDADDLLSTDYVEYLFRLITKCNSDISLTTKMFSNFDNRQVNNENIHCIDAEKATVGILSYNIPIGVYCKMFKTSYLVKEDIHFHENLFMGEGFNFNVDAFQHTNNIIVSDKKIYFYRRDNSTSATTRFSINKCENELKAIDVIKNNLILNSKKVTNALKFAYWRTNSDVFDIIVLANKENDYPNLYKKCRSEVRSLKALYALTVPVSNINRLRAMIMMLIPRAIPWLMIKRNKKYNVKVKH